MSGPMDFGRYDVRRQIGSGAFAIVLEAVDEALDARVAIKVLEGSWATDPEVRERFIQEARLLRRVDHPAFVSVFDIGESDDGRAWFAMTLASRGTLAERLDERGGAGSWDRDDLMALVDTLRSGLGALHEAGVVHRDITPRNLLIDASSGSAEGRRLLRPDERLLIADLGLAKDLTIGGDALTMLGGTPRYQAPEQTTPMAPIDRRADVYAATAVVWEVATGSIPPLAHELHSRLQELTPSWREFMARGLAAGAHERFTDMDEWGEAVERLVSDGVPLFAPAAVGRTTNPYPGLRSYDLSRAAFFSGREALVDEIVRRLGSERALAVGGASGAGKSSMLFAGVVPTVSELGLGGVADWSVAGLTPGPNPMRSLANALDLPGAPSVEAIRRVALERGATLLIVDQFEEVFTRCESETERTSFIELLEELATAGPANRVVIAVRSDFYAQLATYPWMEGLLEQHVFVGPMGRAELRRAIERPALRAGSPVTGDLIEAVLEDAAASQGALPHVSHALARTFDESDGGELTLERYRSVGGVSGALASSAEALVDALGPAEVGQLRDLLLRLVIPGDGDTPDARGAVAVTDLPEQQRRLVDRLAAERLVTVRGDEAGSTVEIAHEALLGEWDLLAQWVADHRTDITAQRALSGALREWADRTEDPDYLLSGSRLARYQGWLEAAPVSLTDEEQRFLQASESAEAAQRDERRRQTERDARLRRRTRVLTGLAIATVAVVALAVFAFRERNRAEDLASEAAALAEEAGNLALEAQASATEAEGLAAELAAAERALRLTTDSSLQRGDDPELALMLAIEAARATGGSGTVLPSTIDGVHWSLQAAGVQYPSDATTEVAVRSGPAGLTGVFALAPESLIEFAQAQLTRDFSLDECERFFPGEPCPDPTLPVAGPLEVGGGASAYVAHPAGAVGLTGTQVLVTSAFSPGFGAEFIEASLDEVGDAVGIDVIHRIPGDGQTVPDIARSVDPGDILILPQPGAAVTLWQEGRLVEISEYLDVPGLRDSYGEYLMSLSSVGSDGQWPAADGTPIGVFGSLDAKSFIWHASPEFSSGGYEVPDTWDELIALSDTMVADGETPWCLSIASGGASGWPASDWVETVVLRTQGPEFYDQWVTHQIPFDHPAVRDAMTLVGELAFRPGYVSPEPAAVAERPFFDAGFLISADPPQCLMLPFPNFAPYLNSELAVGVNIDVFDFPVLDPAYSATMVGGGSIAVALTDRPEVREVMRAIASPEWGTAWASSSDGFGFVPANRFFDLSTYETDAGRLIAERTIDALNEGGFRFDGSDTMPDAIGLGSFLEGLVEYFKQGPDSLDAILAGIEADWVALEAAG